MKKKILKQVWKDNITIYVFGNPLSNHDSIPLILLPKLEKEFPQINFIHADPTENWWRGEKNIIIIDTVAGIKKITVFDDMMSFQKQKMVSPHDYDLYTDLALMQKVRSIHSVKIIGIPHNRPNTNIFKQISDILKRIIDTDYTYG